MENVMLGYPLSPQQKRLHELNNNGLTSLVPSVIAVNIEGECSNDQIELAVKRIAEKYSALRTSIEADPNYGVHLQKVDSETRSRFRTAYSDESIVEEDIQGLIRKELGTWRGDYSLEAINVDLSERSKVLILAFDPQFSDIEPAVILEDLSQLMVADVDQELLEEEVPYYAVSEWLNDLLTNDEHAEERSFWNNKRFDHYDKQLSMSSGSGSPGMTMASFSVDWTPELWAELKKVADKVGSTIDDVTLACWNLTLHLLGEDKELTVGVHTRGRQDEDLEKVVGTLNRYVPLYSGRKEDDTLAQFIQRTTSEAKDSVEYADYFDFKMFSKSNSSQSVFSYGFESRDASSVVESGGHTFRVVYQSEQIEPVHLGLNIQQYPDRRDIVLRYNEEKYTPTEIGYIADIFTHICNKAYVNLDEPVSSNIIPDHLTFTLQSILQGEVREYATSTLVEMLDEQALKTPDQVAVVSGNTLLTFREIHEKSKQLAHYLHRTRSVGHGDVVGVSVERSPELVIALLSVLRAGAAYVPLDPDYPNERLSYIRDNARIETVLLLNKNNERLNSLFANPVFLEEEGEAIATEPTDAPTIGVDARDIAYILYTSGSTGRPKGVKVSHQAVSNHMHWMNNEFPLSGEDAVLQKTSINFDASVWEFYAPLTTGARLVLAEPDKHADPDYLLDIIHKERITTLQVVPTMLQALVEKETLSSAPLKRVFSGGERLGIPLQKAFFAGSNTQLINLYGPTEASIDTTYHICDKDNVHETIGRPIHNTNLLVLDSNLNLVPPGVAGELYISGKGLADGYVDEHLNDQAFLAHSYAPDNVMYKTGDRVRYLPDGHIEYIGRVDRQVKLRGYRIELGEIEKVLNEHPHVRLAAAKLLEKTEPLLAAYVELDTAGEIQDVKQWISSVLPEYMIPSAIQVLDHLPLLSNGKIDYHALPDVDVSSGAEYAAPTTTVEQIVAQIWRSVLKREQISIDENFFALGGHSLIATQVISGIRQQAGVNLPLRKIFDAPTIRELSEVIENLLLEANGYSAEGN
ncbi:amino acid adenylation domain-containing protein [Paenibacillus polymyxa]|uniref:non-ribosomal peptide synthetase n=1 Tax=Paenibacillus polymyxa TaxID=1406 RepID=UPI001BE9E1C2|nr:non-ribosomal peptide synthetase [Paenibacillus polymyxa]MBT2287429.1 amino acid adenylation domain-containing protein [Paenibacillus polymyxa]